MTVAQIVLLADAHWPPASSAAAPDTGELGTIDDLMRLAAAQK